MFANSLRLRLILAFSAMVALILFVGVVSYRINEEVRTDVADMRATNFSDLRGQPLDQIGLEIEGYWNDNGAFIANKVTQEPNPRRPQLRGAVQAVAPLARKLTIYGIELFVPTDVECADAKEKTIDLLAIKPGQRIDVSCKVEEDGRWTATKLQLQNVKSSDKVKGTATKQAIGDKGPGWIEIHGLRIVLEPQAELGPESALARIGQGTQMQKALQDVRVAAHSLVEAEHRLPNGATLEPSQGMVDASWRDLSNAAVRFQRIVLDARSGSTPDSVPVGDFAQQFEELAKLAAQLDRQVDELQNRRAESLIAAQKQLDTTFEPFLDTMFRFVSVFLEKSGEELRDELRDVQSHVEITTKVALGTSAVAVAVALALGFLVWRSIHVPIRALHLAAVALGQGRLETRVEIRSNDEMGVLAAAFNRMASELATTTVSVAGLEGMFESMAAGVIVCDQQGRISNANRAAQELVQRARHELVGVDFSVICRLGADAARGIGSDPRGSVERTFLRRDGSELPVSLSVAELRSAGGQLQGHVFVAQDLTPIKRIEAQLRESLGEKEMLLREVHHRVKNNMQVISSLLAMQNTGADPQVLRRLEESQNRIRTIALIHEQLYQSTEVSKIDIKSYLNVLATHLLQSFGMSERVALIQDVENVDFDIDQCLACGLIVNELLTNAMKYAFPDDRRGLIRLTLRQQTDGTKLLEVRDDGKGLPPSEGARPSRKTLGTSLIAKLAKQLKGKVETDGTNGTTVRIVMSRSEPAPTVNS